MAVTAAAGKFHSRWARRRASARVPRPVRVAPVRVAVRARRAARRVRVGVTVALPGVTLGRVRVRRGRPVSRRPVRPRTPRTRRMRCPGVRPVPGVTPVPGRVRPVRRRAAAATRPVRVPGRPRRGDDLPPNIRPPPDRPDRPDMPGIRNPPPRDDRPDRFPVPGELDFRPPPVNGMRRPELERLGFVELGVFAVRPVPDRPGRRSAAAWAFFRPDAAANPAACLPRRAAPPTRVAAARPAPDARRPAVPTPPAARPAARPTDRPTPRPIPPGLPMCRIPDTCLRGNPPNWRGPRWARRGRCCWRPRPVCCRARRRDDTHSPPPTAAVPPAAARSSSQPPCDATNASRPPANSTGRAMARRLVRGGPGDRDTVGRGRGASGAAAGGSVGAVMRRLRNRCRARTPW
jgi:hypothetical protein